MKKLLRILGTLTALLLLVGYFAFSTYFFSPFEGGLDADVAGLVPTGYMPSFIDRLVAGDLLKLEFLYGDQN